MAIKRNLGNRILRLQVEFWNIEEFKIFFEVLKWIIDQQMSIEFHFKVDFYPKKNLDRDFISFLNLNQISEFHAENLS